MRQDAMDEVDPDWDEADRLIADALADGSLTPSQVEEIGEKLRNTIRDQFLLFCDEHDVNDLKRETGLKEIDDLDTLSLAVKQACFYLRSRRQAWTSDLS